MSQPIPAGQQRAAPVLERANLTVRSNERTNFDVRTNERTHERSRTNERTNERSERIERIERTNERTNEGTNERTSRALALQRYDVGNVRVTQDSDEQSPGILDRNPATSTPNLREVAP